VAAHPLTDSTVLFTKRFASKVEEGRRLSRTSAKQIASPAAVGLDEWRANAELHQSLEKNICGGNSAQSSSPSVDLQIRLLI
jgi:hypothetical protein